MGQCFLHPEAHLCFQKGVELEPKRIKPADFMAIPARQRPHKLLYSFRKFSCRPRITHHPRSWQGLSLVVFLSSTPKVLLTSHCGSSSSCTTARDIHFLLHHGDMGIVGLVLRGKTTRRLTWAEECGLTLLMESAIKAERGHL